MIQRPSPPKRIHFGRPVGLLRLGTIIDFDSSTLKVSVYIGSHNEYDSIRDDSNNIIQTQLPVNHFNPKGGFAGGFPTPGTPILVAQGDGGRWFAVNILAKDTAALNRRRPKTPELGEDEYHIQADDTTFINFSPKTGIVIGENNNALTVDTNRDVYSNTFDNIYHFTEASRTISGNILRDKKPNENYSSSLRESSLDYNDTLQVIGFDPKAKPAWANTSGSVRNPIRVEQREVIYEYAKSFNVQSDDKEFIGYKDNKSISSSNILSRRDGRADVLSLSLSSPNFLIESIKGTVVDIYGNVLDLNRSIIPIGKIDKLSVANAKNNVEETDPLGNVFHNMKALERRSIAYHWEMNAKKDLTSPPNVYSNVDYARDRSRFFFDIDKEGQFKLNVPASSEVGNISLLARYENYSTVYPNDKTKDPNDLVFNNDNQDILLDTFSVQSIDIVDDLNGNASPIDRFSNPGTPQHIKYGTAYHDILQTLGAFSLPVFETDPTTRFGNYLVNYKENYFDTSIRISGDDANGGGRSGSMNFDGSIDLSIGANTINRHSLVADLQGAMIMNVGRDITKNNEGIDNNISIAIHADGEVVIQSGGDTPDNDSRFSDRDINNGSKPGAIEIRIINSQGGINVIRIAEEGVDIHSESKLNIYSEGDMNIRNYGTMDIESPNLVLNGRKVRKDTGLGEI